MKKNITNIINDIKTLINDGDVKNARLEYVKYKAEVDEFLNSQKYISINGHEYSGYNKMFLSMFRSPGVYGTFDQWKKEKRKVKKGEKGFQIGVPIIDKETEAIKYMKSVYIFSKEQTEAIAS